MESREDKRVDQEPGYTIVWYFMPEGWAKEISDHPEMLSMPYLLDGKEYEKYREQQEAALTPHAMLCGILLCWFGNEAFWGQDKSGKVHDFLGDILENLSQDYGGESLEITILDVAADVRNRHDSLMASNILKAGNSILPQSSKIRSDLIIDLWMILETDDNADRLSNCSLMTELFRGIELEALKERPQEALVYINLVCLALLGRTDKRNDFFWQCAGKEIEHPFLRARMHTLMHDIEPELDNYRIWNRGADD